MRILVTGGAGFIGSHTVVELLKNNHDVTIVDNFCNSKRSVIEKIKQLSGKSFRYFECDITDFESMDNIFKKSNFEAVIHFAALKSGADSIKEPGLYYHNNIDGTFNILTLMEKYNVKKIVFSSSATVYGNSKNVPILESEIIGNVTSPYGMTKYLCELLLKKFCLQRKGFQAIALRYFNPIGAHPSGIIGEDSPFDVPNNLILYLLKVAKNELPYLKVFGNDYPTKDGTGLRDYIHVVDLAQGHVAALNYFEKENFDFEVFNLGTGSGHTVMEVIKTFENANNVTIPYQITGRRPGDVEVSFASVKKANTKLGWKAKLTLEDALRDVWRFEINK